MKAFVGIVLGMLAMLMPAARGIAGPAYPLKLSPGHHYMVDQKGTPFLVQGASPWYITELLTGTNPAYYFMVRSNQGYNSVILDIAAEGSPQDDNQGVQWNQYLQFPFTNTVGGYTNLAAANNLYFTNVDNVIQTAGQYGICCFCYPMYDGYGGISWYDTMAGNTTNALYAYGQFIGNRYKNVPNIVWVGAGDYNEPGSPQTSLWNWIAAGIRSADTNHLFTAQPQRGTQAILQYSNLVTVEATYWAFETYDGALKDYQLNPVVASFDREPYYEYNATYNCSALNCRQFAYWAVFYGDTSGQFYGNEREWPFTTGWQTQIVDTAATTIPNLGKLMNTRLWYNLVPDSSHTVVISGYGTDGTTNFAAATREASGKTVMAYIPQGPMTLTVAMTNISGATANAWWYSPANGVATVIGSYGTTGTQTFTSPDSNDWVLVLDDASQGYPPPGVSYTTGTNVLKIQAIGGNVFQLTVPGIPGQTNTIQSKTNLIGPWQALWSGTVNYSGTLTLDVTGSSPARFYRSVQ